MTTHFSRLFPADFKPRAMTSGRQESLGSKTISSIGYKSVARFVTFGLQAVTTVVLARNLIPSDYGIAGYAMIFIGFLSSFNDMGIGSAIIQRKNLDDEVLDTAFSLRATLGLLAFVSAWLLAPIAAASFGNIAVSRVIRVLSLSFLIGSFGFVASSILLRELEFGRWVGATLIGAVLRTAAACLMAISGYGFWSIVIANLVGSTAEACCFMAFSKRKINFRWRATIARELFAFGLPIFSSGLLAFALFNTDNLVIGSVAGAAILGYYAIAFNWGCFSSKIVYEVLHSVLFPAFARIQDERALLQRTYLRLMEQVSVFGFLVQVGLFVCAKDFLVVVLGRGGEKWLPAWHSLQIFSIYGLMRLLIEPIGNVLIAVGRPRLMFRATLLAVICEIVLLYPTLKYTGMEGVAVLVTIAYVAQCLVYWPFVFGELGLRVSDLAKILLPSLLASIPAALCGLWVSRWLPSSLVSLAIKASFVTAIFIIIQGMLSSWRWLEDWQKIELPFVRQKKTS